MSTLAYHLAELAIARDPADPRRCMPEVRAGEHALLDIGCGIGQFFATALPAGSHDAFRAVGIDIDEEALAYAREHLPAFRFLNASGEALPLDDASFDLVSSRVSLPYMDMTRSLGEIHRVLRPGGRVWLTLHPFTRTLMELKRAVTQFAPKDVLYRSYVFGNGLLLHVTGRTVPFPGLGRSESFQTTRGIRKAMQQAGFEDIRICRGTHFIAEARKPATG